jgi:hypothetical protein
VPIDYARAQHIVALAKRAGWPSDRLAGPLSECLDIPESELAALPALERFDWEAQINLWILQDLTRRIDAGDEQAIGELCTLFRPLLEQAIWKQHPVTRRDPHMCNEILNSVLANMLVQTREGGIQDRGPNALLGFILTIARRKVSKRIRKAKVRREVSLDAVADRSSVDTRRESLDFHRAIDAIDRSNLSELYKEIGKAWIKAGGTPNVKKLAEAHQVAERTVRRGIQASLRVLQSLLADGTR